MKNMVLTISSFIALLVGLTLQNASASGPVHGAKSAATGTAFVAVADDPSAMAANPGGIGFLEGTRIYAGTTWVYPQARYTAPGGKNEQTESKAFFPPYMYITSDFGAERTVWGLGLFSPFGIGGLKWADAGPTRYASTENLQATFEVNPTVAFRPVSALSIAVGAVYLGAYNRVEQMLDQTQLGADDGKIRFEAEGDGWGWNAGLLWKMDRAFQIGLSFRSAIDAHLEGQLDLKRIPPALQTVFGGTRFSSDASTNVHYPPVASIGAAWDPSNSWTLQTEIEWVGWSVMDQQTIKIDRKVPEAGLTNIRVPMNWKDAWLFKVGAEYRFNQHLSLRAGYNYMTNPVPESTLSPAMPDAPQHYISMGFGYTWGRWTLDAFYGITIYETQHVENQILSGTYHSTCQYAGLGLGIAF